MTKRPALALVVLGIVAGLLGPLLGRADIVPARVAVIVAVLGIVLALACGAWDQGLVRGSRVAAAFAAAVLVVGVATFGLVPPGFERAANPKPTRVAGRRPEIAPARKPTRTRAAPTAFPLPSANLFGIKPGPHSPLAIPPPVLERLKLKFNGLYDPGDEARVTLRKLRGRQLIGNLWQKGLLAAPNIAVVEPIGLLAVVDVRYGFSNEKSAEKFMIAILSNPSLEEMDELWDVPRIGDASAAFVKRDTTRIHTYAAIFRTGSVVGVVEVSGGYNTMKKQEVYNLFEAAGVRTRNVLRRSATSTK